MPNWVASWLLEHPEYATLPIAKRAKHAIHFRRPDGKVEALFVGKPMHFESVPGAADWQPIDTDLRDIGGGVLSGLGTPAQIETDGAVAIKGSSYKQRPARIVRFRPSNSTTSNIATIPGNGTASGDTLTRSGTGWTYTVRITEDGARQELVLSQAPSFPGGTRDTDYICVEEELTGHSLPDGEMSTEMDIAGMRFPLPTAWDANGDSPVTRRWALTSGGKQYLYTGVPVSWLATAVYPVTVDPDFAGDTADGYTEGNNADYATARSTLWSGSALATEMHVGQQYALTLYRVKRSYPAFDTSSIGAGATVTQVNLKLTATNKGFVGTNFDVQIVKANWSPPLVTDANYDLGLSAALDDNIWKNTADVSINTQYASGNLDTAYVNKTGTTYYANRSSRDSSATPPTGYEVIYLATSDHATEAYRPVLTVLYSAGGTAHEGAGIAAGASVTVAAGQAGRMGQGATAGASTATAAGTRGRLASALADSASTSTATGTKGLQAVAAAEGASSTVADGLRGLEGAAVAAGTSVAQASAGKGLEAAAVSAGTSTATAQGLKGLLGTARADASSNAVAQALKGLEAAAIANGASTAAAAGLRGLEADAAAAGASAAMAAGQAGYRAQAVAASTSTSTAIGTTGEGATAHLGEAIAASTSSAVAAGLKGLEAAARADGTSTSTTVATKGLQAAAQAAGASTTTAQSSVGWSARAVAVGASASTAAATKGLRGASLAAGASAAAAIGLKGLLGAAMADGASNSAAVGLKGLEGAAVGAGSGVATAAGVLGAAGQALGSGVSLASAAATLGLRGEAAAAGTSSATASATHTTSSYQSGSEMAPAALMAAKLNQMASGATGRMTARR